MMILRGIDQDHTSTEIAAEIGVGKGRVLFDLRAMSYNNDPELKQAYLDKGTRAHAKKQFQKNLMDERFRKLTGMTIDEKNFENMIHYYKAELQRVYKSHDECTAIFRLSGIIRSTLKRNKVLVWHNRKLQLSVKARALLRN
jgi:hypothetical protein